MPVNVSGTQQGPNCYEIEIRLTGKHSRGHIYSLKTFLDSLGLMIDKDYGVNARNCHRITVITKPEAADEMKNRIEGWGRVE